MNKLPYSLHEIYYLDALAGRELWINRLHPLIKLSLALLYIVCLMSLPKYDFFGACGMGIYLLLVFQLSALSFSKALRRLKLLLPPVLCLGLFNPFWDANQLAVNGITFSAGWLSFLTLAVKGVFAVLASYQLIASTSMEHICAALRLLRVPQILVTQLLLIYRYLTLLLQQAEEISQAYNLRAPKQKGLHISVWGSLVGQLLLRSLERAAAMYDSMLLRGFHGEYYYAVSAAKPRLQEVAYLIAMVALILLLRCVPVITIFGTLLGGRL